MSNDEKKELLSNLKKLQKLAKDNIGKVGGGLCDLMWHCDPELYLALKPFFEKKMKHLGYYFFPQGEIKKRMEWLQVEIEKLEASIVFKMY